MTSRLVAAFFVVLATVLPAHAQDNDFLVTSGKLAIDDFYHLVACRALPGRPCTADIVRWPPHLARNLQVGFAPIPRDYPPRTAGLMNAALNTAIADINASGAALHLVRATKANTPLITIHLTPANTGEEIRGTGMSDIDGVPIAAALVTVWWNDFNHITKAVIVMAADLPEDEIGPVLLEELTQSLGLLTDIRNPDYESISVFSEDSNSVVRLGQQDRAVLRLHYPPG